MNLPLMAIISSSSFALPPECAISLSVPTSIDISGVYRAVFDNGDGVTVTLEVIGMGSESGTIPIGTSGVIAVSASKVSSPATDASLVDITSTTPAYNKTDTFAISESISLDSDPGEVAGCTAATVIDVTITEG